MAGQLEQARQEARAQATNTGKTLAEAEAEAAILQSNQGQ